MKFLDNLCSEDDEAIYKVMYNEYWYLSRFSCLYPKLNTPKWRALSIIQFIFYISCCLYHIILFAITITKLMDDKMELFQSFHYLLLIFIGFYLILIYTKNRRILSRIHVAIGTGLFNYDEKTEEIRKKLIYKIQKKKKILIHLLLTYFSSLPLIMLLLEKYLNAYSGDEKQVLTPNLPISLWIPYDTNMLIGCSTALFLMAVVSAIVVLICANNNLSLFIICEYLAMELKLLIHSLNRLPERTLHLYRLHHGDNTNVSIETMKENKDLSNCYRDCLKQNIIHHQNIIKMFYICKKQLGLILWLTFAMCAVVIAFSGVSAIKSENLILTLYSTEWMSLNKNEVQMIRIMMLRSQIPLLMNYRKITNFDYVTFTSVSI
ncbi:hypothetical protein O3M35_009065 [Rhynocoris fuscipes]|uniref:Odorant receptor n=1 Tax=Rhynocoris fuscipes TaxID=488301 RepID=A0AAW1D8J7_9HEMI